MNVIPAAHNDAVIKFFKKIKNNMEMRILGLEAETAGTEVEIELKLSSLHVFLRCLISSSCGQKCVLENNG